MRNVLISLTTLVLCAVLLAQDGPGMKSPSVSMAPIPPVSVQRGGTAQFQLDFRVNRGFHINSNSPKDEYLIPTSLKLDPPNDIAIGKISYPPGEDIAFAFSPNDKINVYSGDVSITGIVRAMTAAPYGTYRVHGTLTYQACDNAACYPPKKMPVQFDVKIIKPAPATTIRKVPHSTR